MMAAGCGIGGTEPAKEEKQGDLERRSKEDEKGGLEDEVEAEADWPMQGCRSGERRRRRRRRRPDLEASSFTFLR